MRVLAGYAALVIPSQCALFAQAKSRGVGIRLLTKRERIAPPVLRDWFAMTDGEVSS